MVYLHNLNEFERVKREYEEKNNCVLVFDHAAWARTYVSRKCYGYAYPYNGKFGKGLEVLLPTRKSSTYSIREYWLEVKNENQ